MLEQPQETALWLPASSHHLPATRAPPARARSVLTEQCGPSACVQPAVQQLLI